MAARIAETTALDVRRPFTRADAVAAGLDPKLLRGSRFRRLFRGVYVSRATPISPLIRAEGALALHPSTAWASHSSAARIYRLPVPDGPFEHVSVVDQRDRRKRPGIVTHVGGRSAQVVTHQGVRVSAPLPMFVELASLLSLVDLVIVGDAMLRVFDLRVDSLVGACAQSQDRYAAAARYAAGFVREEVDSPMETRLRMLIVLAGLPEPKVNHKIRDEHGHVLIRLDLSYPELRLIVEYDGRQHAEDTRQWNRDLERRESFDDAEWRILVVTAEGIFKYPERTLTRVRKALVGRGCRTLPRRLSEDWRAHFPGRG